MSEYVTKPIPDAQPGIDFIERPWGSFKQYAHNKEVTVSLMTVKPGQRPRLAAQLFGSSTSRPPRCGRSAAGMRMLPSFCWCTSSNAISTRGVAMTVLFNV